MSPRQDFVPDGYQQAVIDWRRGEAVVAAAAGSGKSRSQVERAAALIEEGVRPERILSLMYNKDAAEGFRTKLEARVGAHLASRTPVYTFHAWGYALLRSWYPRAVMLREVLGAPGSKLNPAKPVYLAMDKAKVSFWQKDWRAWSGMADFVRDRDLDWSTAIEQAELAQAARKQWGFSDEQSAELVHFLEAYEEIKRSGSFASIDFADMTFLPCRAIRAWEREGSSPGHPVAALRRLYDHVQCDEAQDTCGARWRLLLHLGGLAQSLVSTGDARQSLYSWQSAEPKRLLARLDEGAALLNLPVNRRSTARIVEHGNAICRGYDWHLGGDALSLPERGEGAPPLLLDAVWYSEREIAEAEMAQAELFYPDEMTEARDVVARIAQAIAGGQSPGSIAILSRTNRGLIPFELGLIVKDIPCRVLGRAGGAWATAPGQELLSYLRLSEGQPAKADVVGIMNRPLRYCTKIDAIAWAQSVRSSGQTGPAILSMTALGTTPKQGLLRLLADLRALNAMPWAERCRRVLFWLLQAWQDEAQQQDGARRRGKNAPPPEPRKPFADGAEDDEGEVETVYRMLCTAAIEAGSLEAIETAIRSAARERPDAVTLSTVHRMKGGQAPTVYVTGVRVGMLPHQKSDDIEEERRIFYVACTRAERELVISCGGVPSEFLLSAEEIAEGEDSMSFREAADAMAFAVKHGHDPQDVVPEEFMPSPIDERTRFQFKPKDGPP